MRAGLKELLAGVPEWVRDRIGSSDVGRYLRKSGGFHVGAVKVRRPGASADHSDGLAYFATITPNRTPRQFHSRTARPGTISGRGAERGSAASRLPGAAPGPAGGRAHPGRG